jgi:hypothetical protein
MFSTSGGAHLRGGRKAEDLTDAQPGEAALFRGALRVEDKVANGVSA